MSTDNIHQTIDTMRDIPHDQMYDRLIQLYPKSKVDFIMYDRFDYEHQSDNDRMNRTDDQFKKDVRKRYDDRCIVSGVRATTQVCHIKPFSMCNEKEKYDPNNGILLRDDIHSLFDRMILTIDPMTMTVRISDDLMNSADDSCYHQFNGMPVDIHENSKYYMISKYQTDNPISTKRGCDE